jgi:HK97 family phage major capsid protein
MTTWTERVSRQRAIAEELEGIAARQTLTRADEARHAALVAEFDALDTARRVDEVRAAVGAGMTEGRVTSTGGTPRAALAGVPGDALRMLDRLDRAGVDSRGLAAVEGLLRGTDPENAQPHAVADYVLAAGDEHYLSAWHKAFRAAMGGQPGAAGLEFNDAERQAWTKAAEYTRALSLGGQGGGYLVPAELDPTIRLTNTGTSGAQAIRNVSTVRQTTSSVYRAITSAGVTAAYAAEAAEATDNSPTLATVDIAIHKGVCWIPFSIEIEQDAADFRTQMAALIADGRDRAEAAAFVKGTGTSQPWGIAARLVQAAKTVATTAQDVLAVGDVYAVKQAVPSRWRANGSWLVSDLAVDAIRRLGEGATSAEMLVDNLTDGSPSRLLGRPLVESTELDKPGATAGVTNDSVAVFGDLRQYVIADRLGMTVEVVPMLLGANRRPTGERGFYAYWRNGADLVVPDAARVLRA